MTDPMSRIPESQRAAVEQEAEEACSRAYTYTLRGIRHEPTEDDRRAARLAGAQAHADVVARAVVAADPEQASKKAAPAIFDALQRREREAMEEAACALVDVGAKALRDSDAKGAVVPVLSVDTVDGLVFRVNGIALDQPIPLKSTDTISAVVAEDGSVSVVVSPAKAKADADVSPDSDADPARFAAREAAWLQHVSNGALFDEVIARGHGRNGSLRIELPELLRTIAGLIRLIPGTDKGAEVSIVRTHGEESPAYDAIRPLDGDPLTVRGHYTFTYPDGETPYAIDVADAWIGAVKFHATKCRDMTEAEHDTAIVTAIAAAEETGL